jgi:hypothetical protein
MILTVNIDYFLQIMHQFMFAMVKYGVLFEIRTEFLNTIWTIIASGDLVVSVLAIGHKVCGFKPGRGRLIFKGDKNPQHAFLRSESKAVRPIS